MFVLFLIALFLFPPAAIFILFIGIAKKVLGKSKQNKGE